MATLGGFCDCTLPWWDGVTMERVAVGAYGEDCG